MVFRGVSHEHLSTCPTQNPPEEGLCDTWRQRRGVFDRAEAIERGLLVGVEAAFEVKGGRRPASPGGVAGAGDPEALALSAQSNAARRDAIVSELREELDGPLRAPARVPRLVILAKRRTQPPVVRVLRCGPRRKADGPRCRPLCVEAVGELDGHFGWGEGGHSAVAPREHVRAGDLAHTRVALKHFNGLIETLGAARG